MSNNIPYINIHTHRKVENEISIEILGIHPYSAESGKKLLREDITSDIEAIGEIGLDFSRPIVRLAQEALFEEQLSLAQELNLPVVIHSVRALDRTLEIVKKFALRAVIFHGFIGSYQQAKQATDRGYFLSFGHRCFASPKTLTALSQIPINQLFLETDEHDISIEEIYNQAAKYRAESIAEIKENIYKNYTKIFNKQ